MGKKHFMVNSFVLIFVWPPLVYNFLVVQKPKKYFYNYKGQIKASDFRLISCKEKVVKALERELHV